MDGTSIRIPVQNVSLVSLDVNLGKPATKDEINAAMQDAAKGELRGVLTTIRCPSSVSTSTTARPPALSMRSKRRRDAL